MCVCVYITPLLCVRVWVGVLPACLTDALTRSLTDRVCVCVCAAIIKSGTLADRRSSIDLLDGLDLDFLGNSLGDSFDGFEFDGAVNECVSGNMNVFDSEGDKFRYRSDSSVVDQDMLEERNHVTGERMHGHGHGHTQSHTHTQSSNGGGGGDDMMDAIQQFNVKSEGVGMASSGGAQKSSTYTTDTSQVSV